MSFFPSISNIIASLSPRRRRQPADRQQQQLNQSSHHNRSPSPSPYRSSSPTTAVNRRRNPPTAPLLSRNEDPVFEHDSPRRSRFFPDPEPDCEVTAAESQATQSYANTGSPVPFGIATTRGQLRSPSPPSVIDFSTHWGDLSQMLTRGQNQKDAQDEARLLGARYKDSHAVKIKPGSSLQNKKKPPGSSAAFRPTDRLSRNARESGPVRTQGKPAHASLLRNNQPKLGPPIEFGDSGRPSKRQRQNDISDGFDLTSREANDSFPLINSLSPHANSAKVRSCHSPSSSQTSLKPKNTSRLNRHDEYRQVEESIHISPLSRRKHRRQGPSNSPEETFTSKTTQQRRSNQHDKKSQESVLQAIEVPVSKEKSSENRNKQVKPVPSSSGEINGARLSRETRESSDEIQGAVTTLPVPTQLGEKHPQGSSKLEDQLISPTRKRSPADITPTDFSGFKRKGKKANDSSITHSLNITYLLSDSVRKNNTDTSAVIHLDEDKIHMGPDVVGQGRPPADISLRKVYGICYGQHPSRKIRLQLRGASAAGNAVDIEFSTPEEKLPLIRRLKDMKVTIQAKPEDFMDKAFKRHERESAQYSSTRKRPLEEEQETSPSALATDPCPGPRAKLSSSLQCSPGKPKSKKLKEGDMALAGGGDGLTDSREVDHAKPDTAVGIVTKSQDPPARATRSMRRTNLLSSIGKSSSPDALRKSPPEDDVNRDKWMKPMVYPPSGKKRAEVTVEDRDRLRENEFLNDNLIAFYLRFLQDNLERTNRSIADRVYFFNSYFYATLKGTKKGSTGINYSGVEKWTRNINLFEYDYIVVPINEDAHWYVAIICNLPSLGISSTSPVEAAPMNDQKHYGQPENGVLEILESPRESPEPASELDPGTSPVGKSMDRAGKDASEEETRKSESPTSKEARQSFASISITAGDKETQEKLKHGEQDTTQAGKARANASDEDDGWPDIEETPQSSPPQLRPPHEHGTDPNEASSQTATASQSVSKSKKKKKKQRGAKFHPSQPSIITFDSLDLARHSTVRILREYIAQEAESKRGAKINDKDIKGMRAQNIPLQPNWSDCGLYLLAYVEKFVQDPDTFVAKLLQREMETHDDWPPLGSGLLRHRLRKFLDDLYDEQTEPSNDKPLMADKHPVSFLLGPPLPIWEDRDDHHDTKGPVKEAKEALQLVDSSKDGVEEKTANDSVVELSTPKEATPEDEPQLVPMTPTRKHSAPQVQIQVAATPPGKEIKKIRESPRSKHKS